MRKIVILLSFVLLAGCGTANKADNISSNIENSSNIESSITNEEMNDGVVEDSGLDYDLSIMSSDMVYATVYQMMVDPKTYIGKSFKIRGNYYSSYSKELDTYYHFCMIKDAAACCAQGIEILWADEKMNRNENCPKEDTMVTVEGVFETYEEGKNTYGRLKDARIVEE